MAQTNETAKLSEILSAMFNESLKDLETKQDFIRDISEAISKLVIGDQNEQTKGALQLCQAIQSQDADLVKYLVANNFSNPNSQLPIGQNPVHLVIRMREKACAMLVALSSSKDRPLDLNKQNKEGDTALHIAATLAREDAVNFLLDRNADPNIQNLIGNTALHNACKMEAPGIARRLLQDPRTDVTIKNKEDLAPNQLNNSSVIIAEITHACLKRKKAALGELEIALSWNNFNDLDLHVFCPHGFEIYFGHKKATCCNGELDIDMNAGGSMSEQPVEHIYWTRSPPTGVYVVKVNHFATHTSPQIVTTKFYIEITVKNKVVWEKTDTLFGVGDTVSVLKFSYPDDIKWDLTSNCERICSTRWTEGYQTAPAFTNEISQLFSQSTSHTSQILASFSQNSAGTNQNWDSSSQYSSRPNQCIIS